MSGSLRMTPEERAKHLESLQREMNSVEEQRRRLIAQGREHRHLSEHLSALSWERLQTIKEGRNDGR